MSSSHPAHRGPAAPSGGARAGGEFRSAVLAATDIAELIGQTVALKRRGKDLVGLCPFHQEKTPSFHVSPSKQFFHCYGCKAGGNAIDFVIKRDRVEFLEALRLLAERAGIPIPRGPRSGEGPSASERKILLDIHSSACAFFQQTLAHPQQGVAAREYLQKRGFSAESIQRFQVGLAPNAWDGLLKSTVGRKYTQQQLALAGLVKPRSSGEGHYDTFRHRIIFPIRDPEGRVIAFGGRVMPGSDDPAKYLNSPETPLFSKGQCVYGLDLGRQRIVETRTVAVVEGYTDVVMAHQFGASNVVSILGTAMTEKHIALLRRFADRIVLLFDPDTAGDAAVNRAVELFLSQPVEIHIAAIPDGRDPDEFLLDKGKEAFEQLLAESADALGYKWRQLVRRLGDQPDLTAQQKAVEEYLVGLSAARALGRGPVDELRWGAILVRVARLTGIPAEQLNRRFAAKGAMRRRMGAVASQAMADSQVVAGGEPTVVVPREGEPEAVSRAQRLAEGQILGLLLLEPQRWHAVQREIHVDDFADPLRRSLASSLWDHQRDEGDVVFMEFLAVLMDAAEKELAIALVEEAEHQPPAERDQMLAGAVQHLLWMRREREACKLRALSGRTSEGRPALEEQDQIAWLKAVEQNARQADVRRLRF